MTRRSIIVAVVASVSSYASNAAAQESAYSLSLQGDDTPKSTPWSQPASISYTANGGKSDSYAVHASGRVDAPVVKSSSDTLFGRVLIHKTNQAGQQQESYAGEFGYHADWALGSVSNGNLPSTNAIYLPTDFSLGFNQNALFPTGTAATCSATPTISSCLTQRQRSIRVMATTRAFKFGWEGKPYYTDAAHGTLGGPAWAYEVSPVLSLFSDSIVDALINPANGTKAEGTVVGSRATLGGVISPRWSDYRLTIKASAHYEQVISKPAARAGLFKDSTHLVVASIDYNFGKRSFETGPGFIPSVGVTYTNGQDPLAGQKYANNFVFGFKLSYQDK